MSERHLELLRLESEQVQRLVDFNESYANFCLEEVREIELLPSPGASPDRDHTLDRPIWELSSWASRVDAASALRAAGQWAMLLDVPRAKGLLTEAGRLFGELGHPFGLYLQVVSGYWEFHAPHEQFRIMIDQLAELHGQQRLFNREVQAIPPALHHPQQQAYALLAGASSRPIVREYGPALLRLAEQSPHRFGVTPVGALGVPIRRYWSVALSLLHDGGSRSVTLVMEHLLAMSRDYAETINSAMANAYLWNHAASPVDVGDIDISGITAILARRVGRDRVLIALDERASDLGSIGRTPIEIGIEIAGAEDARG